MVINKDKVVTLQYTLHENDENGAVVDATDASNPFAFLFGHGGVIPGFESNLHGKSEGDSFAFTVSSSEGYGEYDNDAVIEIPKENFSVNGVIDESVLVPGKTVTMRDQEGNRLNAQILGVTAKQVKLDFNHPMAGKNLYFKGTIQEVRLATPAELEHGHVHGPGGHEH